MLTNRLASNLQPLCYEHHCAMRRLPVVRGNGANPVQEPKYACQKSGCLVRYSRSEGYFVASQKRDRVAGDILPRVRCPHDGAPMYLGEVRPQERSFRLWRCPLCKIAS